MTNKNKKHWALVKAVRGKPLEIMYFAETSEALVNQSEKLVDRQHLFVVDLNKWSAEEALEYYTGYVAKAHE